MGKRGPAKTPTELLLRRGSWLAKNRPDQEPLPPFKPKCPSFLNKHAKTFWRKNLPMLLRFGLITEPDLEFVAFCAAYGTWREAYDLIEKMGGFPIMKKPDTVTKKTNRDGIVVETKVAGMMIEHPALRSRDKSWEQFRRACADFGCNPSARGDIEIKSGKPKEGTGKDRFFNQKFTNDRA